MIKEKPDYIDLNKPREKPLDGINWQRGKNAMDKNKREWKRKNSNNKGIENEKIKSGLWE